MQQIQEVPVHPLEKAGEVAGRIGTCVVVGSGKGLKAAWSGAKAFGRGLKTGRALVVAEAVVAVVTEP